MVVLLLWTAACVSLAWRYPRRIASASGPQWRAELAESFADAEGDAERIAVVNDALADVEHDLDVAGRWPVTARWLALYGWLLAVLAGLVWSPEPVLLASVPIAFGAVFGTQTARRRGRRGARACRVEADRFVAAVAGELLHRDVNMPVRRHHGRRRRRR